MRDDFEVKLAKIALSGSKPVLGICRGLQILNAAAGGTLIQDIATQVEYPIKHRQEAKAWYVDADNSRLMGKVFMAARDNPFWMVKPASVPKPMDLSDELERLIKKVEKRLETPVDGDAINVAALKLLRSARDLPVAA